MIVILKHNLSVVQSYGNKEEVRQVVWCNWFSRKSLLFTCPFQLLNNELDHFSSCGHLSNVKLREEERGEEDWLSEECDERSEGYGF